MDIYLTADLCIAFTHACVGANLRASMGYDDGYVLYVEHPMKTGFMTCATAYDVGQAIKVYTQARFILDRPAFDSQTRSAT